MKLLLILFVTNDRIKLVVELIAIRCWGNMMNLLRQSVYLAQETGQTTLTLSILSSAFGKRLRKHVGKADPFLRPLDEMGTACPPKFADSPESTNNRSRRHKQKSLMPIVHKRSKIYAKEFDLRLIHGKNGCFLQLNGNSSFKMLMQRQRFHPHAFYNSDNSPLWLLLAKNSLS